MLQEPVTPANPVTQSTAVTEPAAPAGIIPIRIGTKLRDAEKTILESTLAATHGNKVDAAKMLGISRSAFYAKLKRFGIAIARGDAA
jgi:DNA-binding NtrC family response regulator